MPTYSTAGSAADNRPNIIIIMVDDMGFSDIGCYGSEIQTPNLDSLAQNGLRFSQMYNCARCCPTRASLLTGLYAHQAGVGHMVNDHGHPSYQGFLNDNSVTIAEVLKRAGYTTLMSGKWHVGGHYYSVNQSEWQPGETGCPTPTTRGFDKFFGTLAGAGSFFNPHTLRRQDSWIEPESDNFYYTDAISDEAVKMIDDQLNQPEPFFMYVGYTAPHWPLHAMPEDIERYRGKYNCGWDELRLRRHEELLGSGILQSKWNMTPRDEKAPPWSDAPDQEWEDLRMAVYSAQIDRMDQGVGKIMDKLKEADIDDNTLVMFLSDNGGCAEFLREDGSPTRVLRQTCDGREVRYGNIRDLDPGPDTTYMSYDLPWANASNTPFRLYKHWVHEGGISTPLIAHWPAVIDGGSMDHEPCHVIDLMTTCVEAAGAEYPAEHNGSEIQPMEGESLVPAFRGDWVRDNPIFWEHEGNRAVRLGNWKLVSKHPGDFELYDMNEDRTELNDLASAKPDRLNEMQGLYQDFAHRCNVVPWAELMEMRKR